MVAFLGLIGGILLVLPRLQQHGKAVQEAIAAISQRAQEDFSGVRLLLAHARALAEVRTMARLSADYVGHNLRLVRARAVLGILIHGCLDAVVLGVLVAGGLEVASGSMTRGDLLAYLALLGVMVWPMTAAGWILASFHRAIAAADRVEEILAVEPEPTAGSRPGLTGHLEVRGLTFRYEGQDRPALSDVSFALAANQKLGLVGPIGSGKTTLLALILRLYDPPRGTVFVDGTDVLDIEPATLRRAFALAPQDPFLFSDTVAGNIRFGLSAPEPDTESSLTRAVQGADLDRDLVAFDAGLQTVVGERGITLSGGQKQRVSLARAMAAGRRALLLDDALSAVDYPTERRILARLAAQRGRQTLIVAAHRLSAVRDADSILVLEHGAVVDRGTHRELLERDGYYARAWRRQSEERALESERETA
jgi:ATP-binding cassette subfamily B protein